jgi:YfiH family protein
MSFSHGYIMDSLANRKAFLEALGIDYRSLVCGQQVHNDRIQRVTLEDRGRGAMSRDKAFPATDALITSEKSLPIAVFTADCMPIFLFDPNTPAIGVVHAGWRGTSWRIAAKTVVAMQRYFDSKPKDMYAAFGPSIRRCCYEVSESFRAYFPGSVYKKGEHYYLDLADANRAQLLALGIEPSRIFDTTFCTSCENEHFFSHRREGFSCGRMMSVMMLK